MKAILGILLGLMLLTSLLGFSYANPVQPLDNSNTCNPTNPNYEPGSCGAHSGGDPPQHGCGAPLGGKGQDGRCCFTGRNTPDACCITGITPHGSEISDIHADECVPP